MLLLCMVIVCIFLLLVLITSFICFYMAFWVPKRAKEPDEVIRIPSGKIYEPYRDIMTSWIKEVRSLPHKEVSIRSFDGLTLCGKYYEYAPGAPIELMMHGYRGKGERDLCGGVQRCFALGRSALVIDQRACGSSQGHVITFGIRESRDCQSWINFIISHFGSDVKIILTGISMGASTVLMAAGHDLPKNVVGVLADCGFTSARDIIKKIIREMKLPADILYPFVRLGALIFGGFDPDESSAWALVKKCRVPVIFFHGESDDFVPCDMSQLNYDACGSAKRILTVPGAGHGLSYLVDREGYLNALVDIAPLWQVPGQIKKNDFTFSDSSSKE